MSSRILAVAALSVAAALAAPSTATAQQPRPNVTRLDSTVRSYEDAIKYYQAGQFQLARKELLDFIGRAPEHAGSQFVMGLVQIELEDLEEARKYLKEAVRLDSKMVAPRGYLGAVEIFLGNVPGAEAQHAALTTMKTDCAGTCEKAAEIDTAIQRIEANAAAANEPASE